MRPISDRLRLWLRSFFDRRAVEGELDEELRFHLDRDIDARVRSGLSPEEARRTALRDFGGVERIKEECRTERPARPVEDFVRDVHFAIRGLGRRPAFAVIVCLTLGVAIGATTSLFSVVDGALLKPLPYHDADRLVGVWQVNHAEGLDREEPAPANYLDWRERATSFAGIAAAEPYSLDFVGRDGVETFDTWLVSEEFFRVLGVRAHLGRLFEPSEFTAGRDRPIVLSYGFWQRRFGGDRTVIGRTMTLDRSSATIIGVLPPYFGVPTAGEMWAPKVFRADERQNRGATYFQVVARLKPSGTLAQAQGEMDGIARALAREYPRTNAERGVVLVPLEEQIAGAARPVLLTLLAAAFALLLVACANVATLLLGRAAVRERELAIRAALGADRWRIVRQLLVEGCVLALLAAVAGSVLAYWGVKGLRALSPASLPRLEEIALDGRALLFALVVSLATVLLFGLVPALKEAGVHVAERLKGNALTLSAARTRRAARRSLAIAEVALSLVLVIGAGLLVRSLIRVLDADRGFSHARVASITIQAWQVYPRPELRIAFVRDALGRLASLPGVDRVGTASALPLAAPIANEHATVTRADAPPVADGEGPAVRTSEASPGYFETLGIRLLRGRGFTWDDDADGAPVVIVSESYARATWPGANPIGQRLRVSIFRRSVVREVVGVVGDVRRVALDKDPEPTLYVPHAQSGSGAITFVVRTRAVDPSAVLGAVKRTFQEINPLLPLSETATLSDLLSTSLRARRFNLILLVAFASVAVLLAAVGVYGVLNQGTNERVRELAVRRALGAQSSELAELVMRESAVLVGLGVLAGVAIALAATRALETMLFGVTRLDLPTFIVALLLIASAAALAAAAPIRRAVRVDPRIALQGE